MTTRKELVAALQLRYSSAAFGDRIRILDEFVALTGYHRKHAIRLLQEESGAAKGAPEHLNRFPWLLYLEDKHMDEECSKPTRGRCLRR